VYGNTTAAALANIVVIVDELIKWYIEENSPIPEPLG